MVYYSPRDSFSVSCLYFCSKRYSQQSINCCQLQHFTNKFVKDFLEIFDVLYQEAVPKFCLNCSANPHTLLL